MRFTHPKFTNDVFKVVLHFSLLMAFALNTSFSFLRNLSLQKPPFISAHLRLSLHILCITAR